MDWVDLELLENLYQRGLLVEDLVREQLVQQLGAEGWVCLHAGDVIVGVGYLTGKVLAN